MIGTLITAGLAILDKVIPDPAQKAAAKAHLIELDQQGELKSVELQLSAIIAEAQSADPWTSRARPSFLYVMYIILLAAIPMGLLSGFQPEIAARIATGFQLWLAAIPEALFGLFGVGYLGYTGAREFGKHSKNKTQ
jgi:hypothetical protein